MKKLTELLTWHEITTTDAILPDAELEVLVFDGFLNDTVKASLGFDENDMPVWIEQVTGQPLQDPQWWCEVPFPGSERLLEKTKQS